MNIRSIIAPATVLRHICFSVFCLLCTLTLHGATYFVRAGATGASTGGSWANAWPGLASIKWSSVSAGSTVCVAGGTYSDSITTGASGTAVAPIVLKRSVASDATCGASTAGWSGAYDSQVIMNGTINLANNYVTIDGSGPNGIVINMQNPTGRDYVGIGVSGPTNGVVLRYIEVAGPCGSTPCNQNGDHRSIALNHWNGSEYDLQTNMKMQYLNLHGACTLLWAARSTNSVIEYSRFADSADATPGNPYCHPNVIATQNSTGMVFRYNEVTRWEVEGIMTCPNGPCSSSWDIYSNVWHNPLPGYHRILEVQGNSNGPHRFYNNTIVNVTWACARTANGGSFASGSEGRNNVFWNSATPCGLPSEDYDYSNKALPAEPHGRGGGVNPFVNLAGGDYHLSAAVAGASPAVNGLSLAPLFLVDRDGTPYSAFGSWSVGAYAYAGSSPVSIQPVPSLSVVVQ